MPGIPPAGTSPASAFEVIAYAPRGEPPLILADKIDPLTGDLASLLEGADLATAFAVEAMRIQRGTGSAVRDTGNRYHELTHVEAETPSLVEGMTLEAFEDAARAGIAELVSVEASVDDVDPSQTHTVVEFRDLLAPPSAPTSRMIFTR